MGAGADVVQGRCAWEHQRVWAGEQLEEEWTQVGWSQIAQYLGVLLKGLLATFCSLQLATEGFCLG